MIHWYIYVLHDPRVLVWSQEGERYVGFTYNLDDRLSSHLFDSLSKGSKYPVHEWIRRLDNEGYLPMMTPVYEGDETEDWWATEAFYIEFFRVEVGSVLLNRTRGGDGGPGHKRFRSGRLPGFKHSEETRTLMSSAATGRKMSIETRVKISNAVVDRPESYRHDHSNKMKGRKLSDETRKKMSESHKGLRSGVKPHQNTVEAVRASNTGRKHTEETRAKMRDSQLIRRDMERYRG